MSTPNFLLTNLLDIPLSKAEKHMEAHTTALSLKAEHGEIKIWQLDSVVHQDGSHTSFNKEICGGTQ